MISVPIDLYRQTLRACDHIRQTVHPHAIKLFLPPFYPSSMHSVCDFRYQALPLFSWICWKKLGGAWGRSYIFTIINSTYLLILLVSYVTRRWYEPYLLPGGQKDDIAYIILLLAQYHADHMLKNCSMAHKLNSYAYYVQRVRIITVICYLWLLLPWLVN